jgi:hypothetical protein
VDKDEVNEVRWKLKDSPVEHDLAIFRPLTPALAETVDLYLGRSHPQA